jgi:hypothetical protein
MANNPQTPTEPTQNHNGRWDCMGTDNPPTLMRTIGSIPINARSDMD